MRLVPRRRRQLEGDLDEELQAHLRMSVRERTEGGEPLREAQASAARELGNLGLIKDAARDEWGGRLTEAVLQDARYAVRALLKSPGFALAAVFALALGIGANTAILSVVDGILLRPLPYADADRLVVLLHRGTNPVSPANFLDWRRESRSFEGMGAAEVWTPNLTSSENPERLQAIRMTADLLPMLGVEPLAGRVFLPGEAEAGKDHVAVISYRLWQRRFAGDPGVLGRTLSLNGEAYTLVGVMPRSFRFAPFWATGAELWAPLSLADRAASRGGSSLRVFARRKPGVSLSQARAEIATITGGLEREFPGSNRDVRVVPLKEKVVGDVRPALLVLLGAVALVLLISCANVAHMLLARAAARRREVAVRAALGASRARILGQMLTESLVLALAGAAAGVALAAYGLQLLVALAPASLPRLQDVGLDARVLTATLVVSLVTGIAFGMAPAFESAAVPPQGALKEGTRTAGAGRGHTRLRRVFVASEVALALVLLVGAGLMIRSFLALQAVDPGFDPRNVLTMIVSVAGTGQAPPGRREAFYRELLERVSAVRGVHAAAAINHLPLAGDIWGWPYAIEGRPVPEAGESPTAAYRVVSPGYFRAMGIPLLRGRDLARSDDLTAPGVVVVNQFMAKRQWPGEDPVGKRISLDDSSKGDRWVTVVGVVKDPLRREWRADAEDEIYVPLFQNPSYLEGPGPMIAYVTLVARTDAEPGSMAPALRAAIWSLDPGVPISEVQTMEQVVADATAGARFQMLLLGLFAAVATVLAATGIYAVMSYAVSRRTQEIGVRMAFGAGAREVLRLVVGEAMVVALLGTAAGVLGALILSRLMAQVLFGVGPADPATYGSVALLLLVVSLLASYLPARRALRISPMAALRQE